MASSHYEVLGLSCDSSLGCIKKAYKERLLSSHPDKTRNDSSSVEVNKIQEAYKVLSNPELREIYDKSLKDDQKKQGLHSSGDGLDEYSLDEFCFNPAICEYCMDCPRCHGKDGFHFSEGTLEEHCQERASGGFLVLAQCSACSLWLKVNFDLAEEYEQADV
ncbi:hypothetical protein HG536_0B01310 [Torulaspora globosa]|uniref:Diphthamide biosynthesis protein 4 n=1 Tax=Torulaspora globosa TaxID=48254 RepID=A0A7G3ZCN3_9SACH|nr:uncharacterized protein HG536_0B01310 [Torulaspora globosa]QLL31269.1 hypothetical protein HG536_0B01310 [Torulaspora globosa]